MTRDHRGILAALLCLGGWCAGLVGCGTPEGVDATYGRRRGRLAGGSVNGVSVLAKMFEREGWGTLTWRRLSPKLEEADVIVWAPDSFRPPGAEASRWLERWVNEVDGRVLVYIIRDFDAEPDYWRMARATASVEQQKWIDRKLQRIESAEDKRRDASPTDVEKHGWFSLQRGLPPRPIRALSADSPWAEGVQAGDLGITLNRRLIAPSPESFVDEVEIETLLASDAGEPIAYSIHDEDWHEIIVVANGSFLLNLPLVNHEHRKLAAALIESCGEAGHVAFLESASDPPVLNEEPIADAPIGGGLYNVWPIGAILLHVTALGVLVCFVIFPIFGRAKKMRDEEVSDFGRHIRALGALLARTRDRQYALQQLDAYEEQKQTKKTPLHLK